MMRRLSRACGILLSAMLIAASGVSARIAIDIEERPVADLSRISNTYHGGARFIYAFLVVEADSEIARLSGYDIGYRLICPHNDVVNHGFYREAHWSGLDARRGDFPSGPSLAAAQLPAAIGYWKIELKNGRNSRGEFQVVPNPENGQSDVHLIGDGGRAIPLDSDKLSQDVTCHGMINQEYFVHPNHITATKACMPGEISAEFMPGVIEMETLSGGVSDVRDPGLRRICEEHGLLGITRMFSDAERVPAVRRSRTGGVFRPTNTWDIYVMRFAQDAPLLRIVNEILALPRCVFAHLNEVGEYTTCTASQHVPNDTKADSSWHVQRIGMPCAWDFALGASTVRVGVIDAGVDFQLTDLGGGFGPGHKIVGGYDFAAPYNADKTDTLPDIEYGDDSEGANHGNAMTSVLGALTNNGVAEIGIAGGWGWGGPGGVMGPAILHFKNRVDGSGGPSDLLTVRALDKAWRPKYGCDVVCEASPTQNSDLMVVLKGRVRDCYNHGTVVVAALSNFERENYWYPACYRNDWVICVQGLSSHPEYPGDPIPERRFSAQESPPYPYGGEWPIAHWPEPLLSIDVSVPAVKMCYVWGDSLHAEKPVYRCNGSGVSYGPSEVAGVAALMLSEFPNLIPSDVEALLSASCTDITTDCNELGHSFPGWDKYTGWGRVNADTAVRFADRSHPCYNIMCECLHGGGVVVDSESVAHTINLLGEDGEFGSFLARRFEVRRGIARSPELRFVWTTGVEGGGWEWSGSFSDNALPDNYNFKDPYCGLVPSTEYAPVCSLFSYVYKLKTLQGDTLGWYPAPPGQLNWQLRMLAGSGASVPGRVASHAAEGVQFVSVGPNPSSFKTEVSFRVPSAQKVMLRVIDVTGRQVRTLLDENLVAATQQVTWDGCDSMGRHVAPGVYLLRLEGARSSDVRKLLVLR